MNWEKSDPGRGCVVRRIAVLGLALIAALASPVAAQDHGHEGPSFSGAGLEPTESKVESKLWFHAGAWWGSLWSVSGRAYQIHRFDQATHQWTDTGMPIDYRPLSRGDALLDGDKLYVGSHRFNALGGASGYPIFLLRYSHDALAGSFALDPGFPVTIGSYSTESIVIDKDSTGTLWATWVQGLRVHTCHTYGGNDLSWSPPALLPGSDSDLTTDEVCALIHFDGDRIGVMWSDQALNLFRFAVHEDGAPDDAWTLETPLSGESDDHIHLATDAVGRVFAVVKNAGNEIKLLVRDAGGTWTQYLVATGADRFTRSTLVLDEERRRIHVFASGEDNGVIYTKSSSLDAIAFAPGTGTIVMRDVSHSTLNNSTTTKQHVDSSTGLVVLAGNETTGVYWHHSVAPDDMLVASFSAAPAAGRAPLLVQFTDTSTGTPTSWSWDFGDGGGSSAQNPEHLFDTSGIYPIQLVVTGAGGSDEETWNDLVTVDPLVPVQTFLPVADARVNEANPTSNTGTATDVRVRAFAGGSYQSTLRFDLAGLSGPAVAAKLRLHCTDGSPIGGSVFPTTSTWGETTVNWDNRPAATGAEIASLGAVTAGTWVEFDVTSAIGAPGLVDFLLTSSSSNSAFYSSREGALPPELVVELQPTPATVADFTASPTSGAEPLSVAFTDLSGGGPTIWSWDFGDGTSSTTQNPVHVYGSAGSFTVSLTASGPGGADVESKGDYVVVTLPPLAAEFEAAPTSGTAPLGVTFTDTSSGSVTAWLWNFGDGDGSTQQNPTHVYGSAGSFTVSLTASGPGGADVESKGDYVVVTLPPLAAEFEAAPTSGTAPLGVTFTDTSSGSVTAWLWNFGDGDGSTQQNPTHVYGSAGSFTVSLTASLPGASDVESKADLVVVTPPAPVAAFQALPTGGAPPLTVAFTDTSSGSVSAWLWDFGDGGGSAEQHPTHVYASPGIFTVVLTVMGPGGADTEIQTGLVSALPPPVVQMLVPVADSRVNEASPTSNSGLANALRVIQLAGSSNHSYLRFDLSALGGSVTSAKLRLSCTDGSSAGGLVFPTSSSWGETTVNWNNRPAASGPEIGALGVVTTGIWAEVDVTAAVAAGGPVSFLITSASSNSATYSSRQSTSPPELVVATQLQNPHADFWASTTAGVAPLSVSFTDLSTGGVTSWSWSFGDGATSSVRNPLHVYAAAGTHTVTLTATNALGSSVEQRANLVSVTAPPPVTTLLPVADSRVNQASPTSNSGLASALRVIQLAGSSNHSYLRFDLSALGGAVTSAKLRLFCTDGSTVGGLVFPTSSSWGETTVNWNNRPAATGPQVGALGVVTTGTWIEVDVTAAVATGGPLSFLVTSTSSNSANYSSRQSTSPPELVLQTGTP